jgi:vacuolar-type H+-ATPase subunit I/STV1
MPKSEMNRNEKTEVNFKKLVSIENNQREIIQKQGMQISQKEQQLQQAEARFAIMKEELKSRNDQETRRKVEQCVDFSIRTLPWWKRSLGKVMSKAADYLEVLNDVTDRAVKAEEAYEELVRKMTDLKIDLDHAEKEAKAKMIVPEPEISE